MARPKSEEKRKAILSAALEVFADRGLSAATTAISNAAGVAEGTLFIYFKTKDDLLNSLYRDIKLDMADAMMSNFPRRKSVKARLRHVWNHYVDWGVASRTAHKVLKQIEVWDGLTSESREAGFAPFAEIQCMADEAAAQRIFKPLPQRFIASAMSALAEATMQLIEQDGVNAAVYRNAGFEMLWAGITRSK
jgi:AcrR family transcriptional regulator